MQVILQPIAIAKPTPEGIYAPNPLRPLKSVSEVEFLEKYAERPRPLLVSFAPDEESNPQRLTAYGFGLDCWYIVK